MSRTLTAVLLATATAGCATAALPPVVAETTHITLRSWHTPEPSRVAWLEHAASTYATLLEVPERRVTLVSFDTAAEVADACGHPLSGARVGCAIGDTAFANLDYYPHEMVHAFAAGLGDPPLWLEEGLAEALGALPEASMVAVDTEIVAWLQSDAFARDGFDAARARYAPAASFVRFLIDSEGLPTLLRLYRRLAHDASVDSQRVAFAEELGRPDALDQLISGWLSRGARRMSEVAVPPPDCAMPTLELGVAERVRLELGVVPSTVIGPRLAAIRTIEVPADGRLSFTLDADPTATLGASILPCGAHLGPARVVSPPGLPVTLVADVVAGHYFVVVTAEDAEVARPGDVQIRADVFPTGACPPALPIGPGDTYRLRPHAADSWESCGTCSARYVLSAESDLTLSVLPVGFSEPGRVSFTSARICSDCDAAACDELDPTGATLALGAGETRVLEVQTDGRADDFQVMLRASP